MRLPTLPELVAIRKIGSDLLALERTEHHFFVGQRVAAQIKLHTAIIITKKAFLRVQLQFEYAKLK